jgi:hypothetical protein
MAENSRMSVMLATEISKLFVNVVLKFIFSMTPAKLLKFNVFGRENGFSRISPLLLNEFKMIRTNGKIYIKTAADKKR